MKSEKIFLASHSPPITSHFLQLISEELSEIVGTLTP